MKTIILSLVLSSSLLITTTSAFAQRSERYKSLNERPASGSSYQSSDFNRHERYQSKPKTDRNRFDQNLNRYNNYSPEEKQRAQDKWKNFKQETTPEERQYILEKMRRNQRR